MAEIKMLTKLALLTYGIVNLLFGTMFVLFLDDLLTPMTGWTNPLHPRVAGGFLVILGVYCFLILLNKAWTWDEVKITYIVLYTFIFPVLIGQILAIGLLTLTAAFVNELIFEIILESVLLILGIVAYWKETT